MSEQRQPLERYIISAVLKRLQTLFRRDVKFVSRYTKDYWWKFLKDQSAEAPQKAIFLQLSQLTFTSTDNSYHGRKLARPRNIVDVVGTQLLDGQDAPSDVSINSIVPTDFVCRTIFVVEGYANVLEVWNTWAYLAKTKGLNFTIDYGKQTYDIRIDLEENMTLPETEIQADRSEAYEIESSITIHGFTTIMQPDAKLVLHVDSNTYDLNGVNYG